MEKTLMNGYGVLDLNER